MSSRKLISILVVVLLCHIPVNPVIALEAGHIDRLTDVG